MLRKIAPIVHILFKITLVALEIVYMHKCFGVDYFMHIRKFVSWYLFLKLGGNWLVATITRKVAMIIPKVATIRLKVTMII